MISSPPHAEWDVRARLLPSPHEPARRPQLLTEAAEVDAVLDRVRAMLFRLTR